MTFTPPERSRATRNIPLRNKGSFRGALVAHIAGHERVIVYESHLEAMTLAIILADPSVRDVHDQPAAMGYIDRDDKRRSHTLDYRVRYDGGDVGFAIKPHDRVWDEDGNPLKFQDDMARLQIAAGHPIRIVTERSFTRVQAQDAQLILSCRMDPDAEADAIVGDVVSRIHGSVSLRSVIDACGIGSRAFRASVRLLGARRILKSDPKRFSIDSSIMRGELGHA